MGQIPVDLEPFITRLIEINKRAAKCDYESLFENPKEDALKQLLEVLDSRLSLWEDELSYAPK